MKSSVKHKSTTHRKQKGAQVLAPATSMKFIAEFPTNASSLLIGPPPGRSGSGRSTLGGNRTFLGGAGGCPRAVLIHNAKGAIFCPANLLCPVRQAPVQPEGEERRQQKEQGERNPCHLSCCAKQRRSNSTGQLGQERLCVDSIAEDHNSIGEMEHSCLLAP